MSPTSTSQALSKTGLQGVRIHLPGLGWLLFIIGIGMMGNGLTYDPTVSSGSFGLDRTYNVGAMNIKTTYTNTGGFLAVCGAVFVTRSVTKGKEAEKGNQGDDT